MSKIKQVNVSQQVDSWIKQDNTSTNPFLKRIRATDGLYPKDEADCEAYFDFLAWYMSLDYLPLMSLPVSNNESWFPQKQIDETGADISPFNTMDFKRLYSFKLNAHHWKTKQLMARLHGLAQTHSCLNNEEGREHTKRVFNEIVEIDFKNSFLQKEQAREIWETTAYET